MASIGKLANLLQDRTDRNPQELIGSFVDTATFFNYNKTNFQLVSSILSKLSTRLDIPNKIYVTSNPDAEFNSIQAAIDSITDASQSNPYVVEVLSPGIYEENVVLKENVYLATTGDPFAATIIKSSSGVTLTIPATFSGVTNFRVETTSTNSQDAAVRVVDGSETDGELPSFINHSEIRTANEAKALEVDFTVPVDEPLGITNSFIGGDNCDVAVHLINGTVFWIGIGVVYEPKTAVLVEANAAFFPGNLLLNTNETNGEWALDVNGGLVFNVFPLMINGAQNGIRLRNGALGAFANPVSLDVIDVPVNIDVTSLLGANPALMSSFGNPLSTWVLDGTFFGMANLIWAQGNLAGRPTSPVPGMTFFANDTELPGEPPNSGVVLTFEPALGWRDYQGNVYP